MLSRSYLAVDLTATRLTAVALRRGRPAPRLTGVHREELDGVLGLSSRQPNVTDAGRFTAALRRVLDGLDEREARIALVLPDRVGRLFLLDTDAPFKSRQEGVDILKWRLKGSLPVPAQQVQLDFQVLERREDGRQRCLAAVIANPVLHQYEELVEGASRAAVQVSLHSLSFYNYYRPRLDLGIEFLLAGIEEGVLTLLYFAAGSLRYQRVRDVGAEPTVLFREVTRTLAEASVHHPGLQRCPVFAHLDPGLDGALTGALRAAVEREVHPLDPQVRRFAGSVAGLSADGGLLAALGAAERLMKG